MLRCNGYYVQYFLTWYRSFLFGQVTYDEIRFLRYSLEYCTNSLHIYTWCYLQSSVPLALIQHEIEKSYIMKPGRICDCRLDGVRQSQNNLFGTSQSLLFYPNFFSFVLKSSYKCSSSITALRNMRNNANYRPIAELLLNECDLLNGKLVEDNL